MGKEDTFSRSGTARSATEGEGANPHQRASGVRELEEAAHERARRNLHQHAAHRHFANGRILN